ncbi:MAG: glycosyltransferase [Candidatus Margulisbacteria bacterium]|nr:glycosyltransferase [Candidatus Margulisiibacteriota bacterium]
MIIKNEAANLAKTLPVLSQQVDELIVIDTGSADNSIEIAKSFGAKVYSFAWIDDFAAARNESLKYANGEWIIWIDADEALQAEDLIDLRNVLETAEESALTVSLCEAAFGGYEKKVGYKRVKIFRNHLGYHFIRPINEQVVDKNNKIVEGKEIAFTIYHWGKHLADSRMKEKSENYIRLYAKALELTPNDPYLHFLIGQNLGSLKRNDEAVDHYSRAFELSGGKGVGLQAMEKRADLFLRCKKFAEAAKDAEKLLSLDGKSIIARNIIASLYLIFGKTDEAIAVLKEALQIKITGMDNLYSAEAMPNFLLGKAYKIKGENENAELCFARAREIAPGLFGVK